MRAGDDEFYRRGWAVSVGWMGSGAAELRGVKLVGIG